jgi:hypothetical protein
MEPTAFLLWIVIATGAPLDDCTGPMTLADAQKTSLQYQHQPNRLTYPLIAIVGTPEYAKCQSLAAGLKAKQ